MIQERILYRKCEGGYRQVGQSHYAVNVIKEQLEALNYELPGGILLYYDCNGDVKCKYEVI